MGWTTLAEMIGGFHAGQSIKALRGQVDATQPGNVTPLTPRGHRTPEQIKAQLEARYAEMQHEMAHAAERSACEDCRWNACDKKWTIAEYRREYSYCSNPLVLGFDKPPEYGRSLQERISLCGPEKALWEPRLSLWQRFIDWFLEPWKGAN